MKTNYRNMTLEELRLEESQLRTALFNLRVGNTTKELSDSSKIRRTRRELARLLTVKGEKERAAAAGGEPA